LANRFPRPTIWVIKVLFLAGAAIVTVLVTVPELLGVLGRPAW
jgi:hypothetical protein